MNRIHVMALVSLSLILAGCASGSREGTPTETSIPVVTETQERMPPTDTSVPIATEPCSLIPEVELVAYMRPSFAASIFAEFPPGMPAYVGGVTEDGWIGFDPGVAQAANIGPFRLRWLPPESPIEYLGDCSELPIIEGPPPGICFDMAHTDTPVYILPDSSSAIVATIPAEGYAAVLERIDDGWLQVDLRVGNVGQEIKGWIDANDANLNGDCPQPPSSEPIETIQLLSTDTEIQITQIKMVSPTDGWAIGGPEGETHHILTTDDGGISWRDVSPPQSTDLWISSTGEEVRGQFIDEDQAVVTFFPATSQSGPHPVAMWRTADRGRSWESVDSGAISHVDEEFSLMQFVDLEHGWYLKEGFAGAGHHLFHLYHTIDNGLSWEPLWLPPETESTCHQTGMHFANTTSGWRTEECPFLYPTEVKVAKTSDGGVSWSEVRLPPPSGWPIFPDQYVICSPYNPIAFTDDAAWLVVNCVFPPADDNLYLYKTEDGGESWSTNELPEGELLVLDPDHLFSLDREIQRSMDGGRTWQPVKTVYWDGQFSFITPELGWAVAREGGELALVRTRDGGESWELIEPVIAAQ